MGFFMRLSGLFFFFFICLIHPLLSMKRQSLPDDAIRIPKGEFFSRGKNTFYQEDGSFELKLPERSLQKVGNQLHCIETVRVHVLYVTYETSLAQMREELSFPRAYRFGVGNLSPLQNAESRVTVKFLSEKELLNKLFTNLLKGTQWVNAYAFSDFLEKLPDLIKDHFVLYRSNMILRNPALADAAMIDRFNASVSATLYTNFNDKYDDFRQDPASFLDEISYQIVEIAQEEVTIEQFRQSLIRFF